MAGEVQVPVRDGALPAYRAMPAGGKGPFPVVLVVQEIFGVHEHIKDVCRRFAREGCLAVAPVELAPRIDAPVLGLYGGADTGIPVADVERMRAALKAAGKAGSEIVLYPEAPHAFFADYRPSYRPEAAADAWKRCLAWFKGHGLA